MMKETKEFVPQIPDDMVTYVDGKITLAGAIEKYWKDLSCFWNAETQRSYFKHYLCEIVPYFADKALEDYDDVTYFEQVIDEIRKEKDSGKRIRKRAEELSANRSQHYRYILERIIKIASEREGFPNVLLGLDFAKENLPAIESVEARQRTRIQKSLSPMQEYAIEEILLADPLADGEWIALLLMWVLGYRNKEACAITWGDIKELPEHPNLHILVLHSSNIGKSRESHTGGKTHNMFRIWVIPPKIYDFLAERKAHIQALINCGEIKLRGKHRSIDTLPVASKKKLWTSRITADEVSARGQEMFRRIKITDEEYAYYRRVPEKSDLLGVIAWDKDPTTYTLRRNVATHLFILGLSLEEIEYLMGHEITNENYRRSDYTNSDMQFALYEKVKKRPIVNEIKLETEEIEISEDAQMKDVTQVRAIIGGRNAKVVIRVVPYLPHEKCSILMKRITDDGTEESLNIVHRQVPSQMTLPSDVYMIKEYHDSYRRAKNRREASRKKVIKEQK